MQHRPKTKNVGTLPPLSSLNFLTMGAMAKMLHLLFDWEYPHWMMLAGAILVALGFIGFAFQQNRNAEPPDHEPPEMLNGK